MLQCLIMGWLFISKIQKSKFTFFKAFEFETPYMSLYDLLDASKRTFVFKIVQFLQSVRSSSNVQI